MTKRTALTAAYTTASTADLTTAPTTTLGRAAGRVAALGRRVPRIVRFGSLSLSSWSVDYVLVLVLNSLTGSVLFPVVVSRLVSCTMSFLISRRLFKAEPGTFWRSAAGYATVQATVMLVSYLGIAVLTGAGAPLWLVKIVVDSSLFCANYLLQSRVVYRATALTRTRRLA